MGSPDRLIKSKAATSDKPQPPGGLDVGGTSAASTPAVASRMMWVDGVGGYLLLDAPEVWIGRDVEQAHVDIAIQGDLRRRHARISQVGGRHFLLCTGPALIDGRPHPQMTCLQHNHMIFLGPAVAIRYRQSLGAGTAVLKMASPHRMVPWTDGIVLMGSNLVLGPSAETHLRCPRWPGDLVFTKRGSRWSARASFPLEVDGRLFLGESAPLEPNSRLSTDAFSIQFEPSRAVAANPPA